jgi:hypothetical protein
VVVKGYVYIRPNVQQGELYVYTLNGSTPNKFFHKDQLPEVIEITKDTKLKIRSYKAGLIDSPILVYNFRVI